MSYPEVENARAFARLLMVVAALGVLGLAASLAAVGASPPAAAAVLAVAGLAGYLAVRGALRRPAELEGKISSFESECGGAARDSRGPGWVYYCEYRGGVACYDPSFDLLHYVRGEVRGGVAAPERPDYRCTLRVRGEEAEGPGGVLVFRGRLYAPDPGSRGRLVEVEGVELAAFLACRDPGEALRELAALAEGVAGARGARA